MIRKTNYNHMFSARKSNMDTQTSPFFKGDTFYKAHRFGYPCGPFPGLFFQPDGLNIPQPVEKSFSVRPIWEAPRRCSSTSASIVADRVPWGENP